MQKGLPAELIERILQESLTLEREEKIARKFLEKNKKTGPKAVMSLKNKGFRSEVINRVISN